MPLLYLSLVVTKESSQRRASEYAMEKGGREMRTKKSAESTFRDKFFSCVVSQLTSLKKVHLYNFEALLLSILLRQVNATNSNLLIQMGPKTIRMR